VARLFRSGKEKSLSNVRIKSIAEAKVRVCRTEVTDNGIFPGGRCRWRVFHQAGSHRAKLKTGQVFEHIDQAVGCFAVVFSIDAHLRMIGPGFESGRFFAVTDQQQIRIEFRYFLRCAGRRLPGRRIALGKVDLEIKAHMKRQHVSSPYKECL
jgi:hypothetical protein